MIEDNNQNLNQEEVKPPDPEKMKRMSIAVKAVGGWFSFFMGMGALSFGTLTPLGTDIFSALIGIIIITIGIILLSLHLRQKNQKGKERIIKMVKYIGGMFLISGFWTSSIVSSDEPLKLFFNLLLYTGIIIFIIHIILKKIWKIKKV